MNCRMLSLAVPLAAAAAVSAYAFGGWAVITVDDLPDQLQVGAPTQLSFMIRQHGVEPMTGLSPSIEAKTGSMLGGTTVRADARPGKSKGQYVASVTIPKPGEWRITINSGFGPSNVTLLPMQAADGATSVATIADAVRGKRLFVAKGCATCHVNERADVKGIASDFGPNLTDKVYDAAFLAMWLENPKIKPPTTPGREMPNLGLSKKEIAALSVFINNGKTVATKQH